MTREQGVSFSDREFEFIRQVAEERGISVEEAANQLMHEGIAKRFRAGTGYAPAKVYELPKRKPD